VESSRNFTETDTNHFSVSVENLGRDGDGTEPRQFAGVLMLAEVDGGTADLTGLGTAGALETRQQFSAIVLECEQGKSDAD
jgi:hypothetical protein